MPLNEKIKTEDARENKTTEKQMLSVLFKAVFFRKSIINARCQNQGARFNKGSPKNDGKSDTEQ